MLLTNEELKPLCHGGYRFEETEDGYLQHHHFSTEQLAYLKSVSEVWYCRGISCAGKTIEFVTDATEFSFEYKIGWVGTLDTIEIMIDGVVEKVFVGSELPEMGKITHTMKSGSKEVVVYLFADAQIVIKSFETNAPVKPVQKGERVLWMGDSITQGYGPYRSAHTYVNVANRILNYELLNQGLGGYKYDKNSLLPLEGFCPDKIIIAYGTNQYAQDGRECVEEYYEKLVKMYPGIPVICITPIYRNINEELMEKFVAFSEIIKDVCSGYDNVSVIDGLKLMGHTKDYLHDDVHPNALGCEVYGRNLAEIIRNRKL